jgi:hypothetical protein
MTNNLMDRSIIMWTVGKREALRKAYNEAVEKQLEIFPFEGDELVTDYAKYLLEFLDGNLRR